MIADSLPIDTSLADKIEALARMAAFSQAHVPDQVRFAKVTHSPEDAFSVLLKILPDLLRFCIICLTSRVEIVQVSALKVLKFVFETQGCSLDQSMVLILKSILKTFPRSNQTNSLEQTWSDFRIDTLLDQDGCDPGTLMFADSLLKPDGSQSNKTIATTALKSVAEPQSGFKSAISSIYSSVLESFISVLSSVSSHILHSIFYEVIADLLVNSSETSTNPAKEVPQEVRVYACKIAEKIITICQGDLLISE